MRTNNIAAVAAMYRRKAERDGGKRRGTHTESQLRKGQPGLPGRHRVAGVAAGQDRPCGGHEHIFHGPHGETCGAKAYALQLWMEWLDEPAEVD